MSNMDNNLIVNQRHVPLRPTKNVTQLYLCKRQCPGGVTFIDRFNEDDREQQNEYEKIPGKEAQNYIQDSYISGEEKINQMKAIRSENFKDYVCFDHDDDYIDLAIKSLNLKDSFRNFSRNYKMLKVE